MPTPVLAAGHLSRWSLPAPGGRRWWIDAPPDWTPVEGEDYPSGPPTCDSASAVLTEPVPGPRGALVHEVPWPARLLACLLLERARPGERSDDPDAAQVCRSVGRWTRRLHDHPPTRRDPAQAVRTPWTRRLDEPPAGALAARPHWRELRRRLAIAPNPPTVAAHGELRTDHVLVALTRPPAGPGVAVLGLPGTLPVADPAQDVGSLLGDLLELAVLGCAPAGPAAAAFHAGYRELGATPDPGFRWRVAGYAALKVVEHELRLRRSRGLVTSARSLQRLDAVAREVARRAARLGDADRGPVW